MRFVSFIKPQACYLKVYLKLINVCGIVINCSNHRGLPTIIGFHCKKKIVFVDYVRNSIITQYTFYQCFAFYSFLSVQLNKEYVCICLFFY